MNRILTAALGITLIFTASNGLLAQDRGACGTLLESLPEASIEELGKDFRRLHSYRNPYCDTTNSDYHLLMKELANKMTAAHYNKDQILAQMGEAYFHGPISEYENQKVTIGRDGKRIGKSLPPQFKVPSGDYYVVYFWRNKDYLVFALQDGATTAHTWWEKGNYR